MPLKGTSLSYTLLTEQKMPLPYFNQIRTKKQNVLYSNPSHGMHTGSSFPFSKKERVIYK